MLRGRDFENALNKALDYGGKAATAYQVGKAAYAAGRFILPLLLYRGMLHGIREGAHRVHRAAQTVASSAAAATIAASVPLGLMATRDFYEKARPALMHCKPGLVRGVDAALSSYDAIRSAIR